MEGGSSLCCLQERIQTLRLRYQEERKVEEEEECSSLLLPDTDLEAREVLSDSLHWTMMVNLITTTGHKKV